jgi:uncharacterized protein
VNTWALAGANLTSPPVLAFLLGLLATAVGGDLRLPEPVYQLLSFYLLLGIGIKGGVALSQSPAGEVIVPILVTLGLGVLIPLLAYVVLRYLTRLGPVDRGALAAHYGSTSLVTFTAATVFLTSAGIAFEGYMTTLLAVLEVPAIIVGLMLAGRKVTRSASWGESLREVLTSRSILLLVGGIALGVVTGTAGYARVEPFFGGLFTGVLTLFLLEMGVIAAKRLRDLPTAGIGLAVFAVAFPVFAGILGIIAGLTAGLSTGGAALLGVLAASASYIAAPAAVRLALPEANPGYYLTASLGITFPFNLVLGIPLYLTIAQTMGS